MPSQHSHIVGGSSAARILNCPGSVALQASLPPVTQRDSFYSIEGTALHSAMELLITGKTTIAKLRAKPIVINEVDITDALITDALVPAMAYWEDFLTRIDTWQLETKVQFPGIKGAFGTADVIGRDDRENITYVTDWKFGAGEAVKAVYEDSNVNEQLMFYACGARHTQPEFFPAGCKVVLTVVQPRARGQEPITTVAIPVEWLTCSKRPCAQLSTCQRKQCSDRKRPLVSFSELPDHLPAPHRAVDRSQRSDTSNKRNTPDYLDTLLRILQDAPAVENLIREARTQAHLMLSNGEKVPGWKLVAKRGTRQWTVDEKALAKKLKLSTAELYDHKLKSPAGVEKLGVKIPNGLAVMVSSGTTIAPVADNRPAITGDPNEICKNSA